MIAIIPVEKVDDLELVKGLMMEYASTLDFCLGFQNFDKDLANPLVDYGPPEGCLLMARYKGQPAGCVALRKLDDGICEMKRMYVKPEFRGLKIGRALAEAVIEEARKIGYARMRLDTTTDMEAANGLYLSLGFRQIEAYCYNPLENALFMELELK
ncbi:MAG: GNAT family N-acetyltransferase [Planctomycetota bacterium]|jgi:ribosomal protein S18 acetylase RimI-like enzyme